MSYKLTEEAYQDLFRIHDFGIFKFGQSKADDYVKHLFNQFEKIAAQPYQYQSVDYIRKNYRRCVFQSESIFYKIIEEGEVEIVRIIGQQDFP